MNYYRLYYFSPRTHGIVRFEELDHPDDSAAIEAVRRMRCEQALELWCGRRKVAEVPANDLSLRVTAHRRHGVRATGAISPA